jgi:hypothetical protein
VSAADQRPTGLSSPADPRLAAVLALVWKFGLYPVAVLAACAYLLVQFADSDKALLAQLQASLNHLSAKLEAHQAAMDRVEAERAASARQQSQRLKGICYGVTEEGSRARAFCDEQ